jgi:hypothetical protein
MILLPVQSGRALILYGEQKQGKTLPALLLFLLKGKTHHYPTNDNHFVKQNHK